MLMTSPLRFVTLACLGAGLIALLALARGTARAGDTWEAVYARLRERPGPNFAADLRLAEDLGRSQAENDLLTAGPAAARATLERLARVTAGSTLGLTFERATSDLELSGRPFPLALLASDTTPVTSTAAPRVVLFHATWAPARELGALTALAAAHPDVPMTAVALDENDPATLPPTAATTISAPATPSAAATTAALSRAAPTNLTHRRARNPWTSNLCRALALPTRGVPQLFFLDPRGNIARASPPVALLELWLGRASR